jgi:TatA/E family protein of Tat protein translocase
LFGLGGAEVAIILLFGFLIFGPDKLPAIARTIGRAVRQFRTAQEQMSKVIQTEVYDPLKDLEPLANPFSGLNLDGISGDKKPQGKKDAGKVASSSNKAASSASSAPEKKVSSDAMQAALAAESSKVKEQAKARSSKKSAVSGEGESFAERRARLEKAHAEAKARQETPASASTPASAAPEPLAAGVSAPSTPSVEE